MQVVTDKEFILTSCQATLFHPRSEVSTAKILSDLLPQWAGVFDSEPEIFPTGFKTEVHAEEQTIEIPKVIFASKSGSWKCGILSKRIDYLWNKTAKDEKIALDHFYKEALDHLLAYFHQFPLEVGRLAAVIFRVAIHDQPGKFLAEHFCKERWELAPLNRPENFELHAHKKYLFEDFNVNSWVRSRTGLVKEDGQSKTVVSVHQDINTLSEEAGSKSFSEQEIRRFFKAIPDEFNKILSLYFPGEES